MIYPVKIYDKFMKLIKVIHPIELSTTFWSKTARKKDTKLSNTGLKSLGEPYKMDFRHRNKDFTIICRMCGKKALRKSGRAVYCSDKCRLVAKKRRDDESKAKRNNTRRKSKKRVR